jgi:hypothetical protein
MSSIEEYLSDRDKQGDNARLCMVDGELLVRELTRLRLAISLLERDVAALKYNRATPLYLIPIDEDLPY